MLSWDTRVTVNIHYLHFLHLFSRCGEGVKMTSCFLYGKWNFLTFRYAFPKEKWSNVIFRAATFNISASLNSQLLHSVSALTLTRQEGWLTLLAHSSCQAGGNLPLLLRRNHWRTEFPMFIPSGLGLDSPQVKQKVPVTLWEDEYLLSWSFPV